jgi:hypothetical protein
MHGAEPICMAAVRGLVAPACGRGKAGYCIVEGVGGGLAPINGVEPGAAEGGLVDLVRFELTTSSMPSSWNQSLTSIDARNKRLSGA